MQQPVCPEFVQNYADGAGNLYPICTDLNGDPVPWTDVPYSSFWSLNLTTTDVAELLSATVLVFAVVASIRFVYRTIVNR